MRPPEFATRISIVTPGLDPPLGGNRVTAERWAAFLSEAGHATTLHDHYEDEPADLLIALHAKKSAASIARFRQLVPAAPIVVVLTGTDHDLDEHRASPAVRRSLATADRIVILQPLAADEVEPAWRDRVRCIVQSASAPLAGESPRADCFEVAVLAHLRAVKDPLLAARAARLLPTHSRVRISHAGAVLESEIEQHARDEVATNPRYCWCGPLSHEQALSLLARSRAMVLSSRSEGGANVISEAVVRRIPILASRIRGTVGILGEDYRGYFDVGDAAALAALFERIESDPDARARLIEQLDRVAPRLAPARERQALAALIDEIT